MQVSADKDKFIKMLSGYGIPASSIVTPEQMNGYIGRVLIQTAERWVVKMRDNLAKTGSNASSSLSGSLAVLPLQIMGQTIYLSIKGNDYAFFLDKGVKGARFTKPGTANSPYKFKGKRPPVEAFAGPNGWIARKGIGEVSYMRNGKLTHEKVTQENNKRLAFIIAKRVYERGIKATGFMSSVVNKKNTTALQKKIAGIVQASVMIQVVNDFEA